MTPAQKNSIRRLVVVLGDQLDADSVALRDWDPRRDVVWMAEAFEESTHVWSHRARIVLFLSAMRHFAQELRERGITVHYRTLPERPDPTGDTLGDALSAALLQLQPETVTWVEAGDYRVQQSLIEVCRAAKIPYSIQTDTSFLCSSEEFAAHCAGRKSLRMEFFYREMRKRHNILMDEDQPTGGEWNFDRENRLPFGTLGPGSIVQRPATVHSVLTREVLELVQRRFADHPGSLDHFDWPITRHEAMDALRFFIDHHLPDFGAYQDAMWTSEPFLRHSRIAAALNLKLLRPLEVIQAAKAAYREGRAPIAATEGFIRQILGWREYVRGIYHRFMPEYADRNALGAHAPLPPFYWTGKTQMNCVREVIDQTLQYAYAHHIQRLMVTGLFALLWGTSPQEVHRWYLAVYVDAVEWVELPNTLGMSQYADGGVMASKPYIASGKYIDRMSNYCQGCRYDPTLAEGERACPFTTLYWEFIHRHRDLLRKNPRIGAQVGNWDRMDSTRKQAILARARKLREDPEIL